MQRLKRIMLAKLAEDPHVRKISYEAVREEFYGTDATDRQKTEALRKKLFRTVDRAVANELIVFREIDGVGYLALWDDRAGLLM